MKMRNRLTRVLDGLLLVAGLSLATTAAGAASRPGPGDIVGNGGDGFRIGDAVQLFDEIEYGSDFLPTRLAAYELLGPVIQRLRDDLALPAFAQVIEDSLFGRTTLWHFVHVRLRDVEDEDPTNVILTYNKVQVAINANNIVQIDQEAYDAMSPGAQASLLLHEALWTGLDGSIGINGSIVRQLVGLIARDDLPPRPNFIRFVRSIVGDQPLSPLVAALDDDAAGSDSRAGRCRASLAGRFVSTGGGCKDITTNLIWSEGRADTDRDVAPSLAIRVERHNFWTLDPSPHGESEFCQQMRDGGHSDWRTPNTREFMTLNRDAMTEVLPLTEQARRATKVWIVDDSYYRFDQPDYALAQIYLRSLDIARWSTLPHSPSGVTRLSQNNPVHGTLRLLGHAVFCVRGG